MGKKTLVGVCDPCCGNFMQNTISGMNMVDETCGLFSILSCETFHPLCSRSVRRFLFFLILFSFQDITAQPRFRPIYITVANQFQTSAAVTVLI